MYSIEVLGYRGTKTELKHFVCEPNWSCNTRLERSTTVTSHEAAPQMIGYLYQMRYALYILLTSEDPNYKISIEKFDDIAFDDGFSVKEMIQTKHHVNPGSLKDNSVDLWKTIKVWLDHVAEDPDSLQDCRFLLITTETAMEDSAASFLKRIDRDVEHAIQLLRDEAEKHNNKSLELAYNTFLSSEPALLVDLFNSVEIIDGAPSITDVEKRLRGLIRLSCLPQYEDQVLERVEGWWLQCAIKALCSPERTLFDYNTARNAVISVAQQFQPDNLPIDQWMIKDVPDAELEVDQRTFIQQLRLIQEPNNLLRRAIKNYYRAFQQRSSWIREDLLLPNELEDYERDLVDEWEQCGAFYDEDEDPVVQGKALYKELMNKNIRIRERCTEPFVMRGSYEMLSDRLEIGWHRDYLELLSETEITERGQHDARMEETSS